MHCKNWFKILHVKTLIHSLQFNATYVMDVKFETRCVGLASKLEMYFQ